MAEASRVTQTCLKSPDTSAQTVSLPEYSTYSVHLPVRQKKKKKRNARLVHDMQPHADLELLLLLLLPLFLLPVVVSISIPGPVVWVTLKI